MYRLEIVKQEVVCCGHSQANHFWPKPVQPFLFNPATCNMEILFPILSFLNSNKTKFVITENISNISYINSHLQTYIHTYHQTSIQHTYCTIYKHKHTDIQAQIQVHILCNYLGITLLVLADCIGQLVLFLGDFFHGTIFRNLTRKILKNQKKWIFPGHN